MMVFTWVTANDTKVCPICRPLHGMQWRFTVGTDRFPDILHSHLDHRPVLDCVRGHTLTHGGTGIGCRCTVKVTVDATSLNAKLESRITEAIQMLVLPRGVTL